jgi:uncharacterized Zn finger protein
MNPPRPAGGTRSPRRSAPVRHEDRRRVFPAVLPVSGPEPGDPEASWWGSAWAAALESAALDPARLARGKAYARRGLVGAVTVAPGRVGALVQGTGRRPYRAEIRVRTLTDDEWAAFLTAAARRPEYSAALLDKDVPRSLAVSAGLLPSPGELVPDCTCPDNGFPCKHAAALCYRTAQLLDEDPFALFLMRGLAAEDLSTALAPRARPSATEEKRDGEELSMPTVFASVAMMPRALPALPPPFPVPERPGRPPAYPQAAGAPDPIALELLAGEAAVRAHTLLAEGADPVSELSVWQDAVRLAAAHPGAGLTASTRALYRDLAAATGRTPVELARAVAAWRQGGPAALDVLEQPWQPPAGPFDRARPALVAAGRPGFRPWQNRLSDTAIQLRYGRDGRWYGYESEPDREDWWPRGAPAQDPVAVLAALAG